MQIISAVLVVPYILAVNSYLTVLLPDVSSEKNSVTLRTATLSLSLFWLFTTQFTFTN